jgi:hypothetical protein
MDCDGREGQVHGANKLPDGAQGEAFLALKSPSIAATLTINPEQYFLHINKSAALANQLLKGIFAPKRVRWTSGWKSKR